MTPPRHPLELWRRFINPFRSVAEREDHPHQARMLMALLSILILVSIISVILNSLNIYPAPKSVRAILSRIALATAIILTLLYLLSLTAHYRLAARLSVGLVLSATFLVVIFDPGIQVNLAFLIIGGLMSSLFLSPRATLTIFAATLLGLLLLPVFLPGFSTVEMINAVFLIVTVGGLVAMAAQLRQIYQKQIEGQTRKLIENEESINTAMRTAQEANVQLQTSILELEKFNADARRLTEMSNLLQACTSVTEAYRAIGHIGPRLFLHAAGALYMLNPSHDDLEAVVTWGSLPREQSTQRFEPDRCWALRLGRPHELDTLCLGLPCANVPSPLDGLCVPMIAQGESLGVLYLSGQAEDKMRAFNEQLAVTATEQISLAVANLRLRDTLRSQSIHDPLTGLYNRRFMEETLSREIRRAERSQRELSVIMLDLDHFKAFNDTFGHEAGDVLLRELGALLKRSIRGGDVACRFGGEEFVLILPEAALEIAQRRAEELREKTRQLSVIHRGQALGIITVSLGVAAYPKHATTAEAVLRAADTALFRAKADGRDRVGLAEVS